MGKRTLNVGCGRDTYGTDFIDVYPSRPGVIRANIDEKKIPFPDRTFDEVYAKFIFEHLRNPNIFLKECHRVLKKGGKLVVITDNAGSWVMHSPMNFLYSRQHYDNSIREGKSDRHYALYTPLHLKNHMESVGFRKTGTSYYWFEDSTTTAKTHILFRLLTAFSRFISFFLPKKITYPHIKSVSVK